MAETYLKGNNTLIIRQTVEQDIERTYEDLLAEKAVYVQQKQADNAKNDANIARMNGFLAQADALGVVPAPADPTT